MPLVLTLHKSEYVQIGDSIIIRFWYSKKVGKHRISIDAPQEYGIKRLHVLPCPNCNSHHIQVSVLPKTYGQKTCRDCGYVFH